MQLQLSGRTFGKKYFLAKKWQKQGPVRISLVILPIFNRYSYFSGSINEEMVKNGQVAFKTFIENRDENTLPGKVHFAPLLYKKSIYLFTLSIDNPTEMYLYSRYYIANII